MKFLTIWKEEKEVLGVKTDKGIINLDELLKNNRNADIPTDMMEVIHGGKDMVEEIENYIANLKTESFHYLKDEDVNWGPAVTLPSKIICVGLNYRKHADETGAPYPETPILFNKFNNTLTGHKQDIKIPKNTNKLDYEVELGIVIGKTAKNVPVNEAINHVFGYVTGNDLSARDLQFVSSQWLLGKNCDDFSPIGPYLVTSDEVKDPNNLQLKTIVNGEEKQNSNTSDMIFNCDEIVSYISKYMTLTPGDLILTGTPEGVIMGEPEDKQVFLKPGDEVTVEIEKLGSLTNKFVYE
ncbi:fumarylacetoacetate hydrolase family protein [Oceanobacillus locisalsi]|uniref:Fumarylacetoacetate hydrolase family protein n=1 Tax=Oceanobacillus locisalsi TaxID=546107 RepID=A0ABW3NDI0_9BACI